MIFNRRTITKLLDLVNLQRHNDNYADIQTDLTNHEGRITGAQSDITTHKASTAAHPAEHVTYEGEIIGAENIKEGLDIIKTELDQAIISGDSGPEAAASRYNPFTGVTHATLPDRLNEEWEQTATQLAETGQQVRKVEDRRFYSDRIVKHNKRRPLITILDDDTRKELYTKLYPIMFEYKLRFTSAAVTGRIGSNVNTITLAQYNEMLASGLVEYISHTKNHVDLTTITLEAAEQEIVESKIWLLENGGNPDYFVTPFGQTNPDTLSLMRKHFKAAFRTDEAGYLAKPPLRTFDVARSDFEKTVAVQKARIDNAISNNAWLIINTHAAYASFTQENLREVIEYALAAGMEFVTISEGMQAFGNLIDIADNGTSEYGGIDCGGVAFGVLSQKHPIRESLQTTSITVPANSNVSTLVTPTKMTLVNSKVYALTPTSNTQGVVHTWSIDGSGRVVLRFNNLTATEKILTFTFNIAEILSTA